MSAARKNDNRPFAIQLEVESLDRMSEPVREGRVKSVSELIRLALEQYDFENVVVVRPAQLLISVRLPLEIRQKLKKLSRAKHTSVGQLVRAAVESFLPRLEIDAAGQMGMPIPLVELPDDEPPALPAPPPTRKSAPRRRRRSKKKSATVKKAKPAARPAPTKPRRKSGMTRKARQG